jgi:hypothetical protein
MLKFLAGGNRFPTESKWSLLTGEDSGQPLVVRRNDSASDLLGSPAYRTRVGIALPFARPTETGLPDNDEAAELYQIEDAICDRMGADELALLVLTITGGNVKELVFYTRDPKKAQLAIDAVRTRVTSHEIQNYVEDDPEWDVYREFVQP